MSPSAGTGRPIKLRCASCRLYKNWPRRCRDRLVATGKTRRLPKKQSGKQHARTLHYLVQYRCLECGHVGWTRHRDAKRLLEQMLGSAS